MQFQFQCTGNIKETPHKKRWKVDTENVENVALQDSSGSSLERQCRSFSYRTPPQAASVLVVINKWDAVTTEKKNKEQKKKRRKIKRNEK